VTQSEEGTAHEGNAELPLWLDLRGTDGMRYALPYRDLKSIELPSPQMLTLTFSDRRVVVHGRNLETVYEGLIREAVTELQEDDVDWVSESETFISKLTIIRGTHDRFDVSNGIPQT